MLHAFLSALGRRVEAPARLVRWSEAPLGFCSCGLGAQAFARELRRAQCEVESDLLVHLGASVIPAVQREMKESPDAGPNVLAGGGRHALLLHAGSGAPVRILVTVSAARWDFPARVRR